MRLEISPASYEISVTDSYVTLCPSYIPMFLVDDESTEITIIAIIIMKPISRAFTAQFTFLLGFFYSLVTIPWLN